MRTAWVIATSATKVRLRSQSSLDDPSPLPRSCKCVAAGSQCYSALAVTHRCCWLLVVVRARGSVLVGHRCNVGRCLNSFWCSGYGFSSAPPKFPPTAQRIFPLTCHHDPTTFAPTLPGNRAVCPIVCGPTPSRTMAQQRWQTPSKRTRPAP